MNNMHNYDKWQRKQLIKYLSFKINIITYGIQVSITTNNNNNNNNNNLITIYNNNNN